MNGPPPTRSAGPRTPAHVLTGFLGSGKTTLLRHLLADPALADTAVIINEFGEVGLDHLLVREVAEDVVLLSSGCLCCTVREDLVSKLAELHAMMRAGQIPAFSRAVIETTGLADPAPIMRALMSEPSLVHSYGLGRVITTLDGVNGDATLTKHREARQQLAMADCVVLTKSDLVDETRRQELSTCILQANPSATRLASSKGAIDVGLLLPDASPEARTRDGHTLHEHHVEHLKKDGHHHAHDDAVATFTVRMPEPVQWEAFVDWLELLLASRGDSILRVKGLLNVEGHDLPLVVQGVQHVLYPPEHLPAWPDPSAPQGWIVFIARDLSRGAIERSLQSLQAH